MHFSHQIADPCGPLLAFSDWMASASHAYVRLLSLAEERDSGQVRRIAGFLASTSNGQAFPLDPYRLGAVDVAISSDMLCCLDALRLARADLHRLVPDGEKRVLRILARSGINWSEA